MPVVNPVILLFNSIKYTCSRKNLNNECFLQC